MDIRVLQYFLAVAREESITRAAESLHMTQPPLSRQLKDLEDEIGKQLLIRGGKKVTLTEDGILLRKRAEEIIALMEKTKNELASSDENIGGDIYIGSAETDAFSMIADIAKDLQHSYPLIRYHIYSGDAGHITERLDKGLIDFGLLVEPFDVTKYDYIRLPVKDTWGILMPADSPLARKDSIRAEDLWDLPLIISHQTVSSAEMAAWLHRNISELNIVAFYDLIYNASRFVKSGLGYAVTLDKLTNTDEDSHLCFRPLSPTLEAGLCIAWKRYQVFSRAAEKFLKEFQVRFSMNEESSQRIL